MKEVAAATPPAGYLAALLSGMDIPTLINVCMLVYAFGLAVRTIWAGAKKLKQWSADGAYRRAKRKIARSRTHRQRGAVNPRLLGAVAAAALTLAGAMVMAFEGRRLTAYQDSGGVWTICDGRTAGVKQGDTATPAQCDAWRREDLAHAEAIVNECIHFPLTESQLAAFISATYNIGPRVVCGSTLQTYANAGRMAEACDQLLRWDMAHVKHLRGLAKRRASERATCLRVDFSNVIGGAHEA